MVPPRDRAERPGRTTTYAGKEAEMSTSNGSRKWKKALVGVAAVAAVGVAGLVVAHPGAGFGPQGAGPGGFGPGGMAGKAPMMRGGFAGPMAGQQLITPEEQQAFVEKMRSAKTPEERQKLAEANHAEMAKRAKDKGVSLPQPRGPHGVAGSAPAPAAEEHKH
jgi:hypothetical protein